MTEVNHEDTLNEVVNELEKSGVAANSTISDIKVGNIVANTLSKFGVKPDVVEKWLGIEECGCKKRQKFLNGVLSFLRPKEVD